MPAEAASPNQIIISLAGEVLYTTIFWTSQPTYDFGDAPDPTYPSKKISNGARHLVTSKAWLGTQVDKEVDSKQIDADQFDDGLINYNPIKFQVKNNTWAGNLFANILIDYNNNGNWADAGEWVVQNMPTPVPQGQIQQFETSVNLPLCRRLRMTLTTNPLTNYTGTGQFISGETEDHYFCLQHKTGVTWWPFTHVLGISWPPHFTNVTAPPHQAPITFPPHTFSITFPPPHVAGVTWQPHFTGTTFPHQALFTFPPHQISTTFPPHNKPSTWSPHQGGLTWGSGGSGGGGGGPRPRR